MDIYERIRNDHKILRSLLDAVLSPSRPETSRRVLFEQLKLELRVHSRVEEAILYSRLDGGFEAATKLERRTEEHENLARLLDALDLASPGSPAWTAMFERLRELLELHMMEEESETFESARRLIAPQEALELGDQMDTGVRAIKKALAVSG